MPAALLRLQARRFDPRVSQPYPLLLRGTSGGEPIRRARRTINGSHPIFIVSRADAAKNHATLRLARAGAGAMKAVAIVSGWIACTDETGERRAILKGRRIRIESRAEGYRVSWRDASGHRRGARWTDDELELYRSHALRSYIEAI